MLLGEHNLQRQDGYEQTRLATESFPHPDFNDSLPNKDHRNDIMLVKMAAPALLTWAVRPLTLSSQCVAAGTRCLISGWGTTSSPQRTGSAGDALREGLLRLGGDAGSQKKSRRPESYSHTRGGAPWGVSAPTCGVGKGVWADVWALGPGRRHVPPQTRSCCL